MPFGLTARGFAPDSHFITAIILSRLSRYGYLQYRVHRSARPRPWTLISSKGPPPHLRQRRGGFLRSLVFLPGFFQGISGTVTAATMCLIQVV